MREAQVVNRMTVWGLCLIMLAACVKYPDDAGWVAEEFVDALVAADAEVVKSLTMPKQRVKIEGLMDDRQPFRCKGVKFLSIETSAVGSYDSDSNEWRYGVTYQCASKSAPYCLNAKDIVLKETEKGWRVQSWGEICETSGYAIDCEEMCR